MTADELAAIRDHVGTTPTDAEIVILWDRLGTVEAVSLAIVRQRLADMRAKAAKFTAEGDYSEDFTENLAALERQEAKLATASGSTVGGGVLEVGRLVRGAGRGR